MDQMDAYLGGDLPHGFGKASGQRDDSVRRLCPSSNGLRQMG